MQGFASNAKVGNAYSSVKTASYTPPKAPFDDDPTPRSLRYQGFNDTPESQAATTADLLGSDAVEATRLRIERLKAEGAIPDAHDGISSAGRGLAERDLQKKGPKKLSEVSVNPKMAATFGSFAGGKLPPPPSAPTTHKSSTSASSAADLLDGLDAFVAPAADATPSFAAAPAATTSFAAFASAPAATTSFAAKPATGGEAFDPFADLSAPSASQQAPQQADFDPFAFLNADTSPMQGAPPPQSVPPMMDAFAMQGAPPRQSAPLMLDAVPMQSAPPMMDAFGMQGAPSRQSAPPMQSVPPMLDPFAMQGAPQMQSAPPMQSAFPLQETKPNDPFADLLG